MSYKSVHRDFLSGLEEGSTLCALKYDAFRKLWHQLTPHIQIMSPRTDLCDTCQQLRNDLGLVWMHNFEILQLPQIAILLT